MIEVLGLPLESALEVLWSRGIEVPVIETAPFRGPRDVGRLRVVALREDPPGLIVSRFLDTAETESLNA